MKISMIAAIANNNAIGNNNKMPWSIPEDLMYFKQITMGKPVIMGRKTFDSLTKPLPGRTNIVITKNSNWFHENVEVAKTIEDAITIAQQKIMTQSNTDHEIMIIGGEQIYRLALKLANRIYLTKIHQHFDGDAFFPTIDQTKWQETIIKDVDANEKCEIKYSHVVLDRL